MYTIKQAALRTGLSVELLRAWERRYGVPTPARTGSGYRLYDEGALALVRRMKALVDTGWSPSQAAEAVTENPPEPIDAGREPGEAAESAPLAALPVEASENLARLVDRFVWAARDLDVASMEATLGEAFAVLGVDRGLERFLLPAIRTLGSDWAAGRISVAAEHAASAVVMRRLAALYDAAPAADGVDCVIGLPPGGRHEIGALSFAVVCRRVGLGVLYLGADVPVESWLLALRTHPAAAASIAAVTAEEAEVARRVVAAIKSERPNSVVAIGGAFRVEAAAGRSDVLVLGDGLLEAAHELQAAVPHNARPRR